MFNFEKIETKVFEHKNLYAYAPEAIDGGSSKRPVSGWNVRKTLEYEGEDKYVLEYVQVFNCYDGWDSDTTIKGKFDTYEGAVLGAYCIDLENEKHNLEQESIGLRGRIKELYKSEDNILDYIKELRRDRRIFRNALQDAGVPVPDTDL